jgi:hypothetical protein
MGVMGMAATGMGVIIMAALLMMGCATASKAANAAGTTADAPVPTEQDIRREQGANNVDNRALRSTVLDWSNRTVGENSIPLWLKPLMMGNSAAVKSAFGVAPDARVKLSQAQRPNRDEARVQAGLLFAAQVANELKQYVMAAAGQTLDEGQMDVVEEITTATKVTISGTERVTDFWQLVETEDPGTRAKTREYVYYVVWAMPQATWTALTRKYVNDVIGKIPDRAVQTNVAKAYTGIEAAANRETEMTEAEFLQKLRLQEQAARDAQERDMAKINQQTAQNQAMAQTAQEQVRAEARARYAAYKYGDPATAAAASTTAADFDWISALNTAASIVF